jgi:hypothetical protein
VVLFASPVKVLSSADPHRRLNDQPELHRVYPLVPAGNVDDAAREGAVTHGAMAQEQPGTAVLEAQIAGCAGRPTCCDANWTTCASTGTIGPSKGRPAHAEPRSWWRRAAGMVGDDRAFGQPRRPGITGLAEPSKNSRDCEGRLISPSEDAALNLREEITELEVRIVELAEALEQCRKFTLAAKIAIVFGALLTGATLLGVLTLTPMAMLGGVAALLGGIVVYGSNGSTSDELSMSLHDAEARRAALIGRLDIRLDGNRWSRSARRRRWPVALAATNSSSSCRIAARGSRYLRSSLRF